MPAPAVPVWITSDPFRADVYSNARAFAQMYMNDFSGVSNVTATVPITVGDSVVLREYASAGRRVRVTAETATSNSVMYSYTPTPPTAEENALTLAQRQRAAEATRQFERELFANSPPIEAFLNGLSDGGSTNIE